MQSFPNSEASRRHSRKPNAPHSGRGARQTARGGAVGKVVLAALVLVAVAAGGVYAYGKYLTPGEEKSALIFETVKRGPLEITITERGSLESANNVVMSCLVEGEAGTGILKIVEEGKTVKKDEVIIELDSSKLKNDETAQEIVVEQAAATLKTAEKNLEIQETQNDSDIAAAILKLELAQLDLKKYKEGEYVQEKNTIKGEIELAKEDVSRAKDKYEFTQRLIRKGYAKQSEVEADRVAWQKAEINLRVALEKMKVLEEFTYLRQIAELEANAKEYERDLERVKLKADASLAKYKADLSAAKLTYDVEKSKQEKYKHQIELCTMKAPRDGMVVYANTRAGGFRMGTEPLIYEGAKVKERQAIINLPDIENMQVNARIHESKISMVRMGLPATIRVDAKAGVMFHGEVSMVSLVASSGNWPNFNLKEYPTNIKLTDDVEKVSELKPGLTAEIEILIDRLSAVLQAPVQSFVERGGKHFAWVLEGNRTRRREVKIGKSNEQVMEILDGLAEGDRVVQTPRTLLPKEIVMLEEEVPATAESPTSALKAPPAGQKPAVPPGGAKPGASPGVGPSGSPGDAPASGGPGGGPGGPGGRPDPVAIFNSLDKNSDGKITEDEAPEQMKAGFAMMDANKDKAIDKGEFQKAMEAFAQRGGRGGGRGGAGGARPDAGGGQ
ncbi:MAG TPA: efflux RND transporter periplasmic adaptor subunit [Planctomycetaceae bacterium]|nr:efflux RND transporter periplasmic adaptor subunit [Planctomycetaceae bacterium]